MVFRLISVDAFSAGFSIWMLPSTENDQDTHTFNKFMLDNSGGLFL